MTQIVFSIIAARWTRATQQCAASLSDPKIRQLRRNLRQVRLSITHRNQLLQEYARIYHALAAPEDEGSKRKSILLCLAEDAQRRAERVETSLRKFRGAHSRSAGTWRHRVIRWGFGTLAD